MNVENDMHSNIRRISHVIVFNMIISIKQTFMIFLNETKSDDF